MTLFQLRATVDVTSIHVRRYLNEIGDPDMGTLVYYNDVPLAKVKSFTNESSLENFDPAQDYIITLDRELPYTLVGSILQIG